MIKKLLILSVLMASALVIAQSSAPASTSAPDADIIVTLLGTGSPVLSAERFGPSTLIQAGGQAFLFDAGRGASIRLGQLANPYVIMPAVSHVFFTHLHSDHLMGLTDLYMTGWLYTRNSPFYVYGPPGTELMMAKLREAFAEDIKFRIPAQADQVNPVAGLAVVAREYVEDSIVYEEAGVKISAFIVDHGPIEPSFGYKLEYAGKSVVISGDTNYSTNLLEYARGADLIVHEVAHASERAYATTPNMELIMSVHTTPQDAGRLFSEAKPKLAVYSHILLFDVEVEDLITQTKLTYDGDVRVGEDLMRIVIGDQVQVIQ